MDATIVVALIVAVSSNIPNFLNARNKLKLRSQELKEAEYVRTVLYKRTVFENYAKSLSSVVSKIMQGHIGIDLEEYSKNYALVTLYVPNYLKLLIENMHFDVLNRNTDSILNNLNTIIQKIQLELNKSL